MSEAAIERCSPKIMLLQTTFDFDNKLNERTKNFTELLQK